ncbi:hypothetical protein [Wenyingzhuangia sp. IMCC45467]
MRILKILFVCSLIWSCQSKNKQSEKAIQTNKTTQDTPFKFKNKGHELVHKMVQKTGTYQDLKQLKDVEYNYTYTTPDHKKDSVTEKYIFDGELSYGKYHIHQRTLANIDGAFEQGYNGSSFWIKQNGNYIHDKTAIDKTTFNRKTNFYWFTMFQKLLDPGVNYQFLNEVNIQGKNYDIVKITFDTENNKPTDIYQLYINKNTGLVDQFLFTVVDYGVVETPLLMKVEYEKVNGILIPTKRKYTQATWDAKNLTENWIHVHWSNIKFNNELTEELFNANK